MSLLTAYNGVLIRVGLYLLIFWPTIGYYLYSNLEKRGSGIRDYAVLCLSSWAYWEFSSTWEWFSDRTDQ